MSYLKMGSGFEFRVSEYRKIHNYKQSSGTHSLKTRNEDHLPLTSFEDWGLVSFLGRMMY